MQWKLRGVGEIVNNEGEVVADVYGESDKESDEMARLMAAAPELLAACEAMHALLVRYENRSIVLEVGTGAAIALSRAAIEKAKGQK